MGSLLKSLKKFGFVLPKLLLQPKQDFSDYSLFQFAANFWKSWTCAARLHSCGKPFSADSECDVHNAPEVRVVGQDWRSPGQTFPPPQPCANVSGGATTCKGLGITVHQCRQDCARAVFGYRAGSASSCTIKRDGAGNAIDINVGGRRFSRLV
jgi:hypothetical protein